MKIWRCEYKTITKRNKRWKYKRERCKKKDKEIWVKEKYIKLKIIYNDVKLKILRNNQIKILKK